MLSVNGVALDDDAKGWSLQDATKFLSALSKRVSGIVVPGRAGVVSAPSSFDAPTLTLVVRCARSDVQTLLALFDQPDAYLSYTADPSRQVGFEFVASSYQGYGANHDLVDLTLGIRLNGAFWRDTNLTTTTAVTLTSSTTISVFSGLSAPVEDALVGITGPASAVTFTDVGSQASIKYTPLIPAGKTLVYDCAAESASLVTAGQWYGGTDVSGSLEFFGARFRLTPTFTDPAVRLAQLTVVASGTGTGSLVQVQGRAAYLV